MSLSKLSLIVPLVLAQQAWVDSNNCDWDALTDDYVAGTPENSADAETRENCGNWCSDPAKGAQYEQLTTGVDMCCGYDVWSDGNPPYCYLYIGNING